MKRINFLCVRRHLHFVCKTKKFTIFLCIWRPLYSVCKTKTYTNRLSNEFNRFWQYVQFSFDTYRPNTMLRFIGKSFEKGLAIE